MNDNWKIQRRSSAPFATRFRDDIPRAGCFIIRYVDINNADQYEVQILAVFQASSKYWGLPKGRIKYYSDGTTEDLKHAAAREVEEEVGVRVDTNKFSDVIKVFKHYYFITDEYIGTIKPDLDEILSCEWLSIDQFESRSMSRATRNALKQFRARREISTNIENIRNKVKSLSVNMPITREKPNKSYLMTTFNTGGIRTYTCQVETNLKKSESIDEICKKIVKNAFWLQ